MTKNKWKKWASTDVNVLTFNELSNPSYPIKIKEIKIFGAISDLPAKKQNIGMYFGQCELQLLRLWTKSCIIGQLNSEWIYEVIVSPKMPTKNLKDFCPGSLL